jgi:ELWxxDGT repeat protein
MRSTLGLIAALLAASATQAFAAPAAYEVKPSLHVTSMAGLNGTLYAAGSYSSTAGLYKTDGTAAGTQLVVMLPGMRDLMTCGGRVLFAASSAVGGGDELWSSDGTPAGTNRLHAALSAGLPRQALGVCFGRAFYFTDGTNYPPRQLWKTDGTPEGTVQLLTGYWIASLSNAREALYFVLYGTAGSAAVWRTDGTTAGTRLIREFTGNVTVSTAGEAGGLFYFNGGNAVWSTDGTAAGTVQLVAGALADRVFDIGGKAVFFRDGIWTSDGTSGGTTPLRVPMTIGNSDPRTFAAVSGLFVGRAADTASGTPAIWKSDGTAAGTAVLVDLATADRLTDVDGLLFFTVPDSTWVTDASGAAQAITPNASVGFAAAGSRAFLNLASTTGSGYGDRLFAYDLAFAASSVAPDLVSMAGGTPLTISGIGFDGSTTVRIDGAAVTPSSVSPTSINLVAPAHGKGTVEVVVTNGAGLQARAGRGLTFACDAPTAVAGGSATTCASVPVPLTGSGGVACAWLPVTGLSNAASCTPTAAPAATTTYHLTVTNLAGCSSTNAANVTVQVKPAPYAAITTTLATTYGGDSQASVPDAGAGATYNWSITNGQIATDPAARTITFRTACNDARLDVTVTGANGCAVAGTATVTPVFPRGLTSVLPVTGPAGTPIVLNGVGLGCVTALRFGLRVVSTSFHIDSDTQISATFPAGAGSGRIDILVNGVWSSGSVTFTLVALPKPGDIDGDGKPDIVFRNPVNGTDAVWLMNGTAYSSNENLVSFANADYRIVGLANFDNDGSNDLLLHNRATGANAIWKMSHLAFAGVINLPAIPDVHFELEGTGDFNGDGRPDILIRNQVTGANALWLMNGTALQSTVDLPALPSPDYRMAGSGDFNADGKADIVWRNAATGANAVWLMNGTSYLSTMNLPPLPNSGYAIGAVADFDADGKPDLAWRNASTGANAIWLLDGVALTGTINLPAINIPQMEMAGPR